MLRRSGAFAICAALALAAAPATSETNGEAYARFVLASYDQDKDGSISRREFGQTGKANFNDIDANLDGVASAEEIAAWYVRYLRK